MARTPCRFKTTLMDFSRFACRPCRYTSLVMRTFVSGICFVAAVIGLNGAASAAVTMDTVVPAVAAASAPPPGGDPPAAWWAPGAIPTPGGLFNLTTRSAAPHPTTVWMLYDAHNLYVSFKCEQRGTPITGEQTTNNVGFGLDDIVGVGIDTSGVGTQAYYFETTPRGVRYEQANE